MLRCYSVMKGSLILLGIGVLLSACEEKTRPYVYDGKVDSASIGLTERIDTIKHTNYPQPEIPFGLVIDTGKNNPFAADTPYLPVNTTPAVNRYRPNYSTLETVP